MNVLQQGMTTLIRSAITGEAYTLPQGFDLEAACEQICRHRIVPMAYIGAVQCGISADLPVMQKLCREYEECAQRSAQQMKALERLLAALDKAGVEHMLVKDCDTKVLYQKPEMRIVDNADLLIHMEQYARMKQILTELGFAEQEASDQELNWNKDDLSLKLHKRLIPGYNKAYRLYFCDGWRLASLRSGMQYSMVREDKLIYLFTRFAKRYHDGNIDCRYVTDLWALRRAFSVFNDAHIRAELKQLKLLAFYDNIQNMISVWFEGAEATEKTDTMTDHIFNCYADQMPQEADRKAMKSAGLKLDFKEKKSIFSIKKTP